MRRIPGSYWFLICGLIVAALVGAVNAGLTRQVADAQAQAREVIELSRKSVQLADHRQGEIDALQYNIQELQEALDAEMERFESCLIELGKAGRKDKDDAELDN